MKRFLTAGFFVLLTSIWIFWFPTNAAAGTEGNVEVSIFSIGDSKSNTGIAEVGTSGAIIEAEYEIDANIFTLGYERWNYSWTNSASLPFAPGIVGDPWESFSTVLLGYAYQLKINRRWEYKYFVEAESAFEKETNASYAYEVGVEFDYEPSKSWAYTFKVALEYDDLDGSDIGGEVEAEWNPDARQGWSGEFLLSTDAPEITINYRLDRDLSISAFFLEGGGSTVRLSDTSAVPGLKAGYVEDQYTATGFKLEYTVATKSALTLAIQQDSGRALTFTDKTGATETEYEFDDATEVSIKYALEF